MNESMKKAISALASGLLFAIGLAIAGMTLPSKVTQFFNLSDWDPSLALVLIGAVVVYAPFALYAKKRGIAFFGGKISLPTRKDIDARLIIGAILFGLGWGISGYCPGPALTSVATLDSGVLVFAASMLAGFGLFSLVGEKLPF